MRAPSGGETTARTERADYRMGLRLAVLSLAIGMAAVNTGNNLLYLMLALVLALAALSFGAAAWSLRSLRVAPMLPGTVTRDEAFLVGAEVTGRFPLLPQTWVRVRLLGLPERVEMNVPVPGESGRGVGSARVVMGRRGVYENVTVEASTGYPLDLSLRRARQSWRGALVVLPRFDRIARLRLAGGAGRGKRGRSETAAMRPGGHGSQLHNIREYAPSDDARHIDWRSTARTGRLMVREFEREEQRRVDLVLDLAPGAGDEAFETAVERCAAIVDLSRREPFDLRLLVPGRAAVTTAGEAMRLLAAVQPEGAPPVAAYPIDHALARARPDADLVVVSANASRCTPVETA